MDLLSGLIGAILGSVLVILWQSFTDARASRKAITLEALDGINEMRLLMKHIYDAREHNAMRTGNVTPYEDWAPFEAQFFRLLYAARTRVGLKLVYGSDRFSKEYVRIGGLLLNAYRVMPRDAPGGNWTSSAGISDYMNELNRSVAPAVDKFELAMEDSCKSGRIFADITFSIARWCLGSIRGLMNDSA